MYAGVLGFLMTILVGYLVSWLLVLLKKQGEEKIYINNNKNLIKTELFFPIIGKRFKRQSAKYLENINVNENNEYETKDTITAF